MILVLSSSTTSPYGFSISEFGSNKSILHVAELYSDVGNIRLNKQKEIEFIKLFKKHIFMSEGIAYQIGRDKNSKSYALLYGVYRIPVFISHASKDDVFNIVYAGNASKIKGGLFNALAATVT